MKAKQSKGKWNIMLSFKINPIHCIQAQQNIKLSVKLHNPTNFSVLLSVKINRQACRDQIDAVV